MATLPPADNDGWMDIDLAGDSTFTGMVMPSMRLRVEAQPTGGQQLRLRIPTRGDLRNDLDTIHGGAILALIDVALFVGARALTGQKLIGSVTLDLSTQFISAGRVGDPVDMVVEVLRETGSLVFLRGLVLQADLTVAAFSGTLRKPRQSVTVGG